MIKVVLPLIGLPFAAVGAYTFYQSYQVMTANPPMLIPILMFWPFSVIFSLLGWGLILIGLIGKEVPPGQESPLAQRKRQMGILSAEEQWHSGRIQSRGKSVIIGAWLKTIFGFVMVAPVLWIGATHWANLDVSYKFWNLAWAVPLLYAAKAFYKTLRWQKFGSSQCDIQRRPTASSGEFRCSIRPESTPLPGGDSTIQLRCEKRQYQGSGKQRRLVKSILWQDQKALTAQPEGFPMDVSFIIPAEIPETSGKQGEGIFWILTANRSAPGIDYLAEFDLAFKRTT